MISAVNCRADLATDEILSLSIVAVSLQRKIWIMLPEQQYNMILAGGLLLQLPMALLNTPKKNKT